MGKLLPYIGSLFMYVLFSKLKETNYCIEHKNLKAFKNSTRISYMYVHYFEFILNKYKTQFNICINSIQYL